MLNESGDMADGESKKELVVVVSGPSGVGKSTICQGVVRQLNDVYLSTSVTTRPKGPEEIDGEDYWYITREEFERRIENDQSCWNMRRYSVISTARRRTMLQRHWRRAIP